MESDSLVYVVHRPSRFDDRRCRMVPLNLKPAERFGNLKVIFPGVHLPPQGEAAAPGLIAGLRDFRPHDYLLVAGDMDLLVWAAMLATRASKAKLRLLKWDRQRGEYDVRTVPDSIMERLL